MTLPKLELPLRTALLYLLFGGLWILLSDQLLYLLVLYDPRAATYQTLKGWFFICVSGGLLYFVLRRDMLERRQAEIALQNSQVQLSGIFNSAMDAIITVDADERIIMFNPAAEAMFGCSQGEALGQPLEGFIPERFRKLHSDHIQNYARTGETNRAMGHLGTLRALRKDGEEFPVEASISRISVADKPLLTVILRDVTKRRRAEQQSLQLKRLYATLSQVNETIMRVKDERALFDAICRLAVVFGEFRLAWIGLYDRETGQVKPVAESGRGQITLPFQHINLNEPPFSEGLICRAAKSGLVQFSLDIQADPRMAHWHDDAARDGYHSAAVVPLCRGGETVGFLSLYAADIGFFTIKEEQILIEEMGLDISFALDVMEKEAERARAQEALQLANERFLRMINSNIVGIAIADGRGKIVLANDYYLKLLNVSRRDLLEEKVDWRQLTPPEWLPADEKAIRELQECGVCEPYEKEYIRADGSRVAVYIAVATLPGPGEQVIAVTVDITARKRAEGEIRARTRQLAALLQASQSLTESLNLVEVLQKITDRSAEMLGTERAALYLVQGEHLYLGASTPPLPPSFPADLRRTTLAGHPHIAQAVRNGQPVVLTDTTAASLTPDEQSVVDALGLRSILYIPLAAHKGAESILIVASAGAPREFSGNEMDLARALSNLAALAMANAKLYEDLVSYARELEDQIAERRQTERALSKSEERFRLLFENNHTIMMLIEPVSGAVRNANQAAANFYGYSPSELRRMKIEDLNQLSAEEVYAERMRALNEERNYFIFPHRLANGIVRSVEVHSAPVEVDGETLLFSIIYDITERLRAEERLKRHINYLTGLREIDQAIVSSFDLHLSLSILATRAVSLLKADAATILLLDPVMNVLEYGAGHGFWTKVSTTASVRLSESYAGRAVMERRMVHIQNLLYEPQNLFSSGFLKDEKFVSYFGVPLIVKGKVVGVLEVFHRTQIEPDQEWYDFLNSLGGQASLAIDNARLWDQVQRHARDLELRVAERTAALHRTNAELEHASRAKDEFLANMSHELRTPLNSILGLSESLLEQRRDPLTEHQQRSIEIIASSGHHLLDLINDVLDLSKIEAGKFDYYPQRIDVDTLCRSSLSFIKNQAIRKSIAIHYDASASSLNISADPRRLKQVLVNLLTNAVKFTPEHGQVTLEVHADLEHEQIGFSVIDNGIGIAARDLKRLFQPFVQVDSKLNRQYEGTGLGLALVQKLVDLHGGSVAVESEPGMGSRFTVNLPWRPDEEVLSERAAAGELPSHKLTSIAAEQNTQQLVLLAEDHKMNILTISEYLETCGFQVLKAHDGLEAVEQAEVHDPDIILMDIQMPVLDGLEAIRRLRVNPRFARTPIVAITALAMAGDRERCLEAGANEYLSKPVRLKRLVQIIHQFTNKRVA